MNMLNIENQISMPREKPQNKNHNTKKTKTEENRVQGANPVTRMPAWLL